MCRACGLAFVKEFSCSSGNTERWIAKRVWSFARKFLGTTPRRPKVLARYADPKDKLSPVLVWSDMRSHWVEGHFNVMLADCPRCSAKKGTPCYGVAGTTTATHYARKDQARPARLKLLRRKRQAC